MVALAIKEITRILKPGGKLFLTAPLGSGLHQEPYHYYGGYTPYWYKKIFEENGLKISSIEPNKGFYSLFSQELLRFIYRSFKINSFKNLILFPITLFLFLPSVVLPFIVFFIDDLDDKNDFTTRYHVIAIKE